MTFFDKKRPFCSAPVQPDGLCPAARFQKHAAALLKHLHSGAVKKELLPFYARQWNHLSAPSGTDDRKGELT